MINIEILCSIFLVIFVMYTFELFWFESRKKSFCKPDSKLSSRVHAVSETMSSDSLKLSFILNVLYVPLLWHSDRFILFSIHRSLIYFFSLRVLLFYLFRKFQWPILIVLWFTSHFWTRGIHGAYWSLQRKLIFWTFFEKCLCKCPCWRIQQFLLFTLCKRIP